MAKQMAEEKIRPMPESPAKKALLESHVSEVARLSSALAVAQRTLDVLDEGRARLEGEVKPAAPSLENDCDRLQFVLLSTQHIAQ